MSTVERKQSSSPVEWIEDLRSHDAATRIRAREELVRRASPEVVYRLICLFDEPDDQLRWEAAKILETVAVPFAIPALVDALQDPQPGVRWLAAEALVRLGKPAVEAVLDALTSQVESPVFCEGAHHVLSRQPEQYESIVKPVLDALDGPEPAATVPPTAYRSLSRLRFKSAKSAI